MKLTRKHKEFLNTLRENGVTNMFGTASHLVAEFGMEKRDAKKVLVTWMRTYTRPESARGDMQ